MLSVVAALADGQTQVVNAARLRLKESDRLESTAAMLRALGAQVEVHDSGLTVTGRKALTGGTVDPQHDHRIAMAAAAAASGCTAPVTVREDVYKRQYRPHPLHRSRHGYCACDR